jgi:predicted transcriptional regulator
VDTLFPMQQSFHVVRLTEQDAVRSTDSLRMFEEQLALNDEMYPGIRDWFRKKVVPGLREGTRVAYLGFENGSPILTAVVKRGECTKFCHLRIASEFQDLHLGEVFFSIMALEVRNTAKEIHFTLPEGLWERRKDFFRSFGFQDVTRTRTQYRLFEEELRTSAPFWDVWRAVRQRLPKLMSCFSINEYSMSPSLLLSVRPEFASRVLRGEKTVEIRKRFHGRWRGSRVALYASSPERALVGEATIEDVKATNPSELWDRYGDRLGCTKKELLDYAETKSEVFAIELCDVIPYVSKMPLCQFERLLEEDLTPPQSHCEIRSEHPWGKAISIAALLHGCQRMAIPGKEFAVL